MSSDEYEVSDPVTIGGASGQFMFASPWHTECEWALISVLAVGTLGSTATYALGSKNPNQPKLSTTGADSFGNLITSSPDQNNALQSFVGALTAQAPFITYGGDNFMPLPSPAYVYLTTATPATTEVLVTIQFRRKLDRIIPDKPQRPKPLTHSHSTRPGMRTFMEGWAAQQAYPGDTPYEHQPVAEQDTTPHVNLGPTQLRHRGVAKNGR